MRDKFYWNGKYVCDMNHIDAQLTTEKEIINHIERVERDTESSGLIYVEHAFDRPIWKDVLYIAVLLGVPAITTILALVYIAAKVL